jgi:hypothetical protein
MKTVSVNKFKWLFAVSLGCAIVAFGQKPNKRYNESFSVKKDVTIDINTSHTDVELETWDKDMVDVEAFIEVEGTSQEEAEAYFKSWNFEALGNSEKVSISTKSGPDWFSNRKGMAVFPSENMDFDFNFSIPEIPEIDPIIIEWDELSPMPPIPFPDFADFSFDYDAYKKDGDKYLKQWKQEFNKNFDEEFKSKLEKWKEEVEAHKKDAGKHKKEMKQHKKEIEVHRQALKAHREDQKKALEKAGKPVKAATIRIDEDGEKDGKANMYFFRSGSEDKNLKVKKTIKIKLPKGAKLNINVRHGEVKLAENFKNINATLSHTRLLAAMVDGEDTHIEASYSPVMVEYWNQGNLKVNYVKDVALKQVKNVNLSSTSSNVLIGNIINNAVIKGSFGTLEIENIDNNFTKLEMALDNTDAVIMLPRSAFDFSCNTSDSRIDFPQQLQLAITKKYANQLAKGYHKQQNNAKQINITATYSDVVIH